MRVVYFALLCLVAVLLSAFFAAAQDNLSRSFKLDFYNNYCNCDEDCGDFSSCLTDDTDLFIKNLNTNTYDQIEDAKDNGFRGVCTAVTIDGELMIYEMTSDCITPEPESEPETAENKTQDSSDNVTVIGDDAGESQDEITDDNSNVVEKGRVITINFDDPAKTEKENRSKPLIDDLKKITGGVSMDILTAGIIAGTVVLVGFFGLMAWIAYLLQQKAVPKK